MSVGSSNVPVQIGESGLAGLGLGDDVVSRCLALQMPNKHIHYLAQLPGMYDTPASDIVVWLEQGLTLPRVAEAMRIHSDSEVLGGSTIPVICDALDRIGFNVTDPLEAFETDKELYHGQALSSRQMEEMATLMAKGIGAAQAESATPSLFHSPHEILIEALAEAGAELYEDPIDGVLARIDESLGGDILLAFTLMNEKPELFPLFLRGEIDALQLRSVTHEDDRGLRGFVDADVDERERVIDLDLAGSMEASLPISQEYKPQPIYIAQDEDDVHEPDHVDPEDGDEENDD